jgi:hypothetical protein
MEVHPNSTYFRLPYQKPVFNDFERMDTETLGFIEHTLNRHPEMLEPGVRCFIPAHIRRVGHARVREMIWEKCETAVVVMINGVEKNVQYKVDGEVKTVSLISDMEVSNRISEILDEHVLTERPLFITGYLCVGMGQTLMHQSYGNFTHAILSHMNVNNDSIYQLFGRLTGRVKWWDKYQTTKLYCPTPILNRIKVMERCAADAMKKIQLSKQEYELPMDTMPEGADVRENQNRVLVEAEVDVV